MDRQEYSVTTDTPANANVPVHVISGKLQEGNTVVHDFTGDNAIHWPAVLATFTVEQQQAIANMVGPTVMDMKAGIWAGGI